MRARSGADDPLSTEARIMSSPVLFEAIPPTLSGPPSPGRDVVSRRHDEVTQLSGGLYVALHTQKLLIMHELAQTFG